MWYLIIIVAFFSLIHFLAIIFKVYCRDLNDTTSTKYSKYYISLLKENILPLDTRRSRDIACWPGAGPYCLQIFWNKEGYLRRTSQCFQVLPNGRNHAGCHAHRACSWDQRNHLTSFLEAMCTFKFILNYDK